MAPARSGTSIRISRRYGERFADETWQDRTWVSLMAGVVTLVAFNGTLLLPLSYRIGVQALVVVAALVGYAVGTLTEIERDAASQGGADGDRSRDDAAGADD